MRASYYRLINVIAETGRYDGAKALVNIAALVPGVVVAQTSTGAAQDVGGTGGDK